MSRFQLGHDGPVEPTTVAAPGTVRRHSGSEFLRDVAESVVERAHARSEAERSVAAVREWCDRLDEVEDMDGYWLRRRLAAEVRALLPALPETTNRRAEPAGGGDGMGIRGDEDDRELPGGSDTGN